MGCRVFTTLGKQAWVQSMDLYGYRADCKLFHSHEIPAQMYDQVQFLTLSGLISFTSIWITLVAMQYARIEWSYHISGISSYSLMVHLCWSLDNQ